MIEYIFGVITGASVTYIILDVLGARKSLHIDERLKACVAQVARDDVKRALDSYSDQELIRAIASGLDPLTNRAKKPN